MASNKHSADGKIPENGLSSLEKDTSTPKDLGMDSRV